MERRVFMNITGTAAMIAVLCVGVGVVAAAQSSIPNSVCRGDDAVTVRNTDLKTDRNRSTDLSGS